MSYCCRNARSHIPDARTRSLYSYEGAPRPCGASTRHKLEKTALATLVMRSFVKVCSVLALSPRFPGVAFDNHCFIWAERITVTNESRAGAGAGARAVAVVGAGAGELIAEGALAIEMGANATDLAMTIHPHPTLNESIMESAELIHGSSTHIFRPQKR